MCAWRLGNLVTSSVSLTRGARRRSATFVATYDDRLSALAELACPCLVIGFQLDMDTYAARAREVAEALSGAQYLTGRSRARCADFTPR